MDVTPQVIYSKELLGHSNLSTRKVDQKGRLNIFFGEKSPPWLLFLKVESLYQSNFSVQNIFLTTRIYTPTF